ncbi:hypothetical protein L211DRAFT_450552 [Terfezia boudieri ATCC MYA-4762]|uniref:Cyanovirin-N domain-containing protein n=1 Tax=Terfezia boudieri ATCC MYA-4762 TaxID=1051890 RepID=A0A3N4LEN4_9PEZI|nr:hypothetical protein L211DRAFT_450552 [Terfezia boudieri ATCC MYA-4762]
MLRPCLLIILLVISATIAVAQNAGLPEPDSRCTIGLCRPIGEIMASCIGPNASPDNITWDDLLGGENVTTSRTVVPVSMPQKLQCFCSSQGLERRLDTCNGCYVATNQEEYWSTGINNIKIICGFTQPSSTPPQTTIKNAQMLVGIAMSLWLSLAAVDVFGF